MSEDLGRKIDAWNAAVVLVNPIFEQSFVSEYTLEGGARMTRLEQYIGALTTVADWLLDPINHFENYGSGPGLLTLTPNPSIRYDTTT